MAGETSSQGRLAKLFGINAEEHGSSQWTPDSTAEFEIIGLGLSRTGTTSLREALNLLGFGPVHHGVVSKSAVATAYRWSMVSRGLVDQYALTGDIPPARSQREGDGVGEVAE
jgi:hypothetical protein